jgi:hypothetical protein
LQADVVSAWCYRHGISLAFTLADTFLPAMVRPRALALTLIG